MSRLISIFILLSTICSCGDSRRFSDEKEFAQFVASLSLDNLALNEAKEKLVSNGFSCYEKNNTLCMRKLPGWVCNQEQLVWLVIEKNKTSFLIQPKLNLICL